MRKVISFFALLFAVDLGIRAAIPEAQLLARAENKVKAMFRDLTEISKRESANASFIRADFPMQYFPVSDQNAPNEFRKLGFDKEQYSTDIAVRRYINTFFEFFRVEENKDYSFWYEQRSSRLFNEPQFKKGESQPELAQVIVRKVYMKEGKPAKAFQDTLIVGLAELKIRKWANESSKYHIGNLGNEELLNYEQMKVAASIAYNYKQYAKAYSIYQELINKFPDEGEPYYRLAVMLYKKEYNGGMNTKDRNKRIIEYLDKAIKIGTYSIRDCADNMKYWITC